MDVIFFFFKNTFTKNAVADLKVSNVARTCGGSLNPFKFRQAEKPKSRLLSQCPLKLHLLSKAVYIIPPSSIRALTYQQRQDFALVLVIRRHRDVPALPSAKGDAAAVRASDRRS